MLKKKKKEDFDLGSFWVRKIEGVNNFYFIVVNIRPLDVEFAGFAFDASGKTGRYFFNWTELLSNHNWDKWEKIS
jgi:hypothetical protein